MVGREQSAPQGETGNRYCKNCSQQVHPETPFNWPAFIGYFLFGLFVSSLLAVGDGEATTTVGYIIIIFLPSGYVLYWYSTKQPTCPMCKLRNFGSPSEETSSGSDL